MKVEDCRVRRFPAVCSMSKYPLVSRRYVDMRVGGGGGVSKTVVGSHVLKAEDFSSGSWVKSEIRTCFFFFGLCSWGGFLIYF